MRRISTTATWLAATVARVSAPSGARAQAAGPAFDCAKALGEVETLICKDAGLAVLDRTLDGVSKAALAKARDAKPLHPADRRAPSTAATSSG